MFFDRFVKYDGKVEPLTIDDYKILSDELIKKYNINLLQNKIHMVLLEIEDKQMKMNMGVLDFLPLKRLKKF